MENDSPNLTRIHRCTVESVWKSGLLNVVSDLGWAFQQIPAIAPGSEETFVPGDRVIVMTSGTDHFVMGRFYDLDDSDGDQIMSGPKNEWSDTGSPTKRILVEDPLGESVEVSLGTGLGIVLDTGRWCSMLLSNHDESITACAKRLELLLPGLSLVDKISDGICKFSMRLRLKPTEDVVASQILDGEPALSGISTEVACDFGYDKNLGVGRYSWAMTNDGDPEASVDVTGSGAVAARCEGNLVVQCLSEMSLISSSHARLSSGGDITVTSDGDVTVIHGSSSKIRLGSSGSSVPIASSEKTDQRLSAIQSKYDAHTHTYTVPLIPLSPTQTSGPLPTIGSLSTVASPNVLADE